MDARAWDERYAASERLWSAEPNRFVAGETAGLAPGRALDLAAGEGRNAVWLAERGWRVTAVDFSRVALERAAALAERRGVAMEIVRADLATWAPPEGAFDLVLVAYLHVPPATLRAILGRAVRALATGGTLVVVGHDRDNLERGHGGPSDPRLLYSVAALREALDGLTVERAEQVERPVETASGGAVAIDTLVRARRRAPGPAAG